MKNSVLVTKVFYSMLIPTILMNTVTGITSASDTVIVGNLINETALTAITFSTPLYMIINLLAALISVGGTTVMSVANGRGDRPEANGVFTMMMLLVIGFSAIIVVLGTIFIDPIVALLGAKGEQAISTREYAGMIFFMSPFLILNITLAFLVRSDGRPKLAMSGMLISVVANIVSNVIFVGPLNMGLAGAGLATGVASAVSAVILSTHFFSKKNTLKLTKPVISRIPTVFKNGIGTSMTFVYMFITILFFNNLIVRVSGGDGIIVYTVIMNVANIAMSIFEGLSQTVQPMFSVYHGEKNNSAMKATFKLVVKMTVILGGVVTVLLQLFPNLLVRAFGVTGEFAGASVFGIRVFSICIILMTFNVVMGYYYQSTGRPMLATMIVFIRNLAAQNIGALIFGIIWGLNGIWFSYLFSELVTLFIWCVYVKALAQKLQTEGGILLLQPQVNVYNREIECNLEKLPEILQESESFMLSHNIEKKRASRIRLAIEELVSNVINHGGEKLKHIEIRIVLQDEISLIIRDDGILFDHSTFIYSGRADIPGGQGLELVRKTALSFEYRPVLGMNRTLLTY